MDEMILNCGITTVIRNSSDGHPAFISDLDSDIWWLDAMPWNYTGVNNDTSVLALTSGANMTFTIGFNSLWDAYEEASFINILDNWQSMLYVVDPLEGLTPTPTPAPTDMDAQETAEEQRVKPLIKVTTFEDAKEAHQKAISARDELEAEYEQQQVELDEQIALLDEEISRVYKQWNAQKRRSLVDEIKDIFLPAG